MAWEIHLSHPGVPTNSPPCSHLLLGLSQTGAHIFAQCLLEQRETHLPSILSDHMVGVQPVILMPSLSAQPCHSCFLPAFPTPSHIHQSQMSKHTDSAETHPRIMRERASYGHP